MNLPETVRIGVLDFDVEIRDELYNDGQRMTGLITYNDGKLELIKDMTPQYARIVIWHEILHGLLHQAGVGEHPEQLLDILSAGIVQVLRDNPALREDPETTEEPDQIAHQVNGARGVSDATEGPAIVV